MTTATKDNNLAYRLALVSNAIYDYFREYDQEVHCHTTYVGKKLFGLQVNKALGACWYDRELRKIDEICKPLDFAFKIRLKNTTQGKWHTTNIAVIISPYLIR